MTSQSRDSNNSVTGTWPPKYRARFWSRGSLAYRVALVQFLVGTLRSSRNLLGAIGVLIASLLVGVLIGGTLGFPSYWLAFPAIAIVVVVAGVASAVISYPKRSQMFDRYRPGTESQIAVADGMLMLSLNNHPLKFPVGEVARIWRFGDLTAIEFTDTKSVVLPTALVPHWPASGEGPEIIARWGKPTR